jgi:hypothetical protein
MTVIYTAGFSTEGSAQSMGANLNAGTQITVASGTYAPATYASVLASGYTAFTAAVKTSLDGGGGGPYTVTWSSTTGKYTISRAASFTLAFSTATSAAAGTRMRLALGFSGDLSGANTYTSDWTPYYVLVAQMAGLTEFSDVYEPDDIVEEAVADDGTPWSASRETTELYSDWSQAMETKASTFSASATTAVPWTWQAFFRHVRGQRPFAVYDSVTVINTLHKLRAEGGSFIPARYVTDYDGLWSIPVLTRRIGVLT